MTDPIHPDDQRRQWAQRLRAAASLAWQVWPDADMDPEELVRTFRDEAGHRREVDEPFLRATLDFPPDAPAGDRASLEVQAWRAAAARAADLPAAIQQLSAGEGPLTPPAGQPIEIWTEGELCLLHALWRIARLSRDEPLRARCHAAAGWHIQHTQPDNATNHPWAIHVFLLAGEGGTAARSPEAMFHVEQVLHNTMISLGRPDRLSAHILRDAADELDGPTDI